MDVKNVTLKKILLALIAFTNFFAHLSIKVSFVFYITKNYDCPIFFKEICNARQKIIFSAICDPIFIRPFFVAKIDI